MLNNSSDFSDVPAEVGGYRAVHGYISGGVCVVGVILNMVNFIVWSRQALKTSTNLLLATLAVADGLSLLFYLVYVTYFFIATGPSELIYHSESGMYTVVVCFHEFIAFHTFSNWLIISLAIFRYLGVCHNSISKQYCTRRRAWVAVVAVFTVTAVVTVPFYMYYEVYQFTDPTHGHNYWIRKTFFVRTHITYQTVLLWLYGVIFKVLPSVAMIVLCIIMIHKLRQATERNNTLNREVYHSHIASQRYRRSTLMLIMIVTIYFLTELPVGIMAFLSGLKGGESHFFYFLLYSYVGDMIDLIALLNSCLNFFVYIAMCSKFRTTLIKCVKTYFGMSLCHGKDLLTHQLSKIEGPKLFVYKRYCYTCQQERGVPKLLISRYHSYSMP
ncbi:G-protein coupled receptor dmsr-1-like [Ostrea edulis]|uniref:G-protein coupled receptor dmsr-1-like n=1 Tax=Ostrea edulis TaxID=37623 RepID=UPI002094990E|nr:G-protein coupled receptor dmsr-1-like [Ostrea edulis]